MWEVACVTSCGMIILAPVLCHSYAARRRAREGRREDDKLDIDIIISFSAVSVNCDNKDTRNCLEKVMKISHLNQTN